MVDKFHPKWDKRLTFYDIKAQKNLRSWERSEKDDGIHHDIHTLEAKRDEFWEIGTPCVPIV